MLNEIVKRIAGTGADRRTAERFRKKYAIGWVNNGVLVAAIGLEISEKGLLFASKEAPSGPTMDVAMDIGSRRVRARLSVVRKGTMPRDGAEWHLIAGIFQAIAADDWDAVVRFCREIPEPDHKAADELAALASAPDDAYRLLPLAVQERIVAALVAAGRLAPESDAKNPLLRLKYLGKGRTGAHRLLVHSRRRVDGEILQFDSTVSVDDAGAVSLDRV